MADITKKEQVAVIGCGATGGWVALQLAQLGFAVHVYDQDKVEAHNVVNQNYGLPDIGNLKTEATANFLKAKGFEIQTTPLFVETGASLSEPYIFCLTDTMSSRKKIFETLNPFRAKYWIETRTSKDAFRIYGVEPFRLEHAKQYKATLYDDKEAERSLCGAPIPIMAPTAQAVASMAVWQLVSYIGEKNPPNVILGGFDPMCMESFNFAA